MPLTARVATGLPISRPRFKAQQWIWCTAVIMPLYLASSIAMAASNAPPVASQQCVNTGVDIVNDGAVDSSAATVSIQAGTPAIVHAFTGGDGAYPQGGLVQATDGSFYGTTVRGGPVPGHGSVFKLDAAGTLTTLHLFTGESGSTPFAGLIQATDGTFYGTTSQGGTSNFGTVFKIDAAGTLTRLHSFTGAGSGADPRSRLVQGTDGSFYGTTYQAGTFNRGTIFKLDGAGTLTTLHTFTGGSDGGNPFAGLIQATDGDFYGTTVTGGASDLGTIYKLDVAGTLTTLHHFSGGTGGERPYAALMQATDGSFYGTTSQGGAGDYGTVFKLDGAGNLTILHAFSGSDGRRPRGNLMQSTDGSLWGTTIEGGASDRGTVFKLHGAGTLTTMHTFTGVAGGNDGALPFAGPIQAADGNIYGTTYYGGPSDRGTIYRVPSEGNVPPIANGQSITTVENAAIPITLTGFDADGDALSFSVVTPPSHGTLSGSAPDVIYTPAPGYSGADSFTFTVNDGSVDAAPATVWITVTAVNDPPIANDQSVITARNTATAISLTGSDADGDALTVTIVTLPSHGTLTGSAPDVVYTPASNYTGSDSFTFKVNDGTLDSNGATVTIAIGAETVFSFGGLFGIQPTAALIQAADGALYGTTTQGGAGRGTVFKIDLAGHATTVHALTSGQGASPASELIQDSDGNFYGTTAGGGAFSFGTVFKIDAAGTLTTLHDFNGTDGSDPRGPLVDGRDGFFYGTTFYGGSSSIGTVFRIDSTGALTTLHHFTGGADGNSPNAGLILGADGNFHGMTAYGGAFGAGTVFRIDRAGAVTPLHSFKPATDGTRSRAELVRTTDGALWGTTYSGGEHNRGTIFRLDAAGQFTLLHTFTGDNDGGLPDAGLFQASDGNFYGTASEGGAFGLGTVFRMSASGTLTTLHHFAGEDGSLPRAALMQASDGHLYGTTSQGGTRDRGVVYRLALSANQAPFADGQTLTTPQGSAVAVTLTASDPDGDVLTYTIVDAPAHGTLSGSAPALTYTPATGYTGLDSFTFTVNDGTVDSNVATVDIEVVPAVTVNVTAPNGGEKVFVNVPFTIRWTATDATSFDVALSRNGGSTYTAIDTCAGLSGSTTSCVWTPASPASSAALIRVTARDAGGSTVADISDGPFSITTATPSITVTAPNTAVKWAVGDIRILTWKHNLGPNSAVRVELSRDSGNAWELLADSVANTSATAGSLSWLVAGPPTASALVRVTRVDGTTTDTSNVVFSIAEPNITVTAPNTNVNVKIGTGYNITWSHNLGTAESVRIELSTDNGASWAVLAANAPNTSATSGTFRWVVGGPPTSQARIRVSRASNTVVQDTSNVAFRVSSRIAVTAPNTAVTWAAGSRRTITWTHNYGAAQTFDLHVSPDNGASWLPLASGVASATASTGTYTGSLSTTVTTQALVRVSPSGNVVDGDVSNVTFTLAAPVISVTAPNTTIGWTIGATKSVTWTHNLGQAEAVNIEVSRDDGATWTTIASNVANTSTTSGAWGWAVTGPVTTTARIRVSWVANDTIQDTSNVNFRIQ